jgi:hypothetical protein
VKVREVTVGCGKKILIVQELVLGFNLQKVAQFTMLTLAAMVLVNIGFRMNVLPHVLLDMKIYDRLHK